MTPTRKAASLERRHTFVGPTSPLRKSPGPAQFSYTPYNKSSLGPQGSQQQHFQQFSQQKQYQQQLNGGLPYNYGRSATLGPRSVQHSQQLMRPYATMQGSIEANFANVSGRLHVSDVQGTGVTGQSGYPTAQNTLSGGGGSGRNGYGIPSSATGGVATVLESGPGMRRISMNEMHPISVDGAARPLHHASSTTRGHRVSFDGGVPAQRQAQHHLEQQQPLLMTTGPVQQYQPYSQRGEQTHPQMPPPPSEGAGAIGPAVSSPLPLPPNSVTTPTFAGAPNGYYPPVATASQIQDYPPPPPGAMSTSGVTNAPQQLQYSTQGGVSGANRPISFMPPHGNPTSPSHNGGARMRGDPLPYAIVGVSNTSPPHHNTQYGQTSQTGTGTSPGSMGKGGAAVLSKLPTSPSRQASVSHASTTAGGRPREVVTVSSSGTSNGTCYNRLPRQRSLDSQNVPTLGSAYPSYHPQGSIPSAGTMAAPPPTKYTNLQLHQQYRQQYARLQKQGSKTTPYHVPTGTRPTIQRYALYHQRQQQREQPLVAPKQSPPKYNHSSYSQAHPSGQQLQFSPPHPQHNGTSHSRSQGGFPIMHRQQYQPNNVSAAGASLATASPGRALHVQVNNTSGGELVPKSNTQQVSSPPRGEQFEPQSTQPYDTLPAESDSLSNLEDESLTSMTEELDRFTEEMSKALEQFDSLLQSSGSNPLVNTSL